MHLKYILKLNVVTKIDVRIDVKKFWKIYIKTTFGCLCHTDYLVHMLKSDINTFFVYNTFLLAFQINQVFLTAAKYGRYTTSAKHNCR